MLPKEWGGLGQNHVMYAHVTETIARYGDASCAMCYVMHIGAVEALKLRATEYTIEKYLKKVRDGLIGTLSYSDPETGSHFWYPIASGARRVDGGFEVLKKASWTTSAGFADFYVLQTTSPDYNGDYSNLSVFVVDKDEIEAKPRGVGRDGPARQPVRHAAARLEVRARGAAGRPRRRRRQLERRVGRPELPDRLVRHAGTASRWARSTSPSATPPARPTRTSACGCATTRPSRTRSARRSWTPTPRARSCSRSRSALDKVTDGSQTNPAIGDLARGNYLHWLWQIKFNAAKNVAHVVDKMLHCCGGTGFKKEPLQLERYLRDGKAGWVMGPTNEVLRQFVGKTALLGMESLDYWNQVDQRAGAEQRAEEVLGRPEARAGRAADRRGRRVANVRRREPAAARPARRRSAIGCSRRSPRRRARRRR